MEPAGRLPGPGKPWRKWWPGHDRPHPHPRLRLPVRPAHRAPDARGPRLFGDPPRQPLPPLDPRDGRPGMTFSILILAYGAQCPQLIARRVREAHAYSEILSASRSLAWIREFALKGIILSGGPNSVYDEGAPLAEAELLQLGVPVL